MQLLSVVKQIYRNKFVPLATGDFMRIQVRASRALKAVKCVPMGLRVLNANQGITQQKIPVFNVVELISTLVTVVVVILARTTMGHIIMEAVLQVYNDIATNITFMTGVILVSRVMSK